MPAGRVRHSVDRYPYTVRITFRLPGFEGVHTDDGAYRSLPRAVAVCDRFCTTWGRWFDQYVPSASFSVIDCRDGSIPHHVWWDATRGVESVHWFP